MALCVAVETSPDVGLGFVLEASSDKIFRADILPSRGVIRWREGHLDEGADQKLARGGCLVLPCRVEARYRGGCCTLVCSLQMAIPFQS